MYEKKSINRGFEYAIHIEDDFIEEYPTLARAKREAKELAREHEGTTITITKYREVYRVKEYIRRKS